MELDTFLGNLNIDDTNIVSNTVDRNVYLYMINNNSEAASFKYQSTYVVHNRAILEENKDGFYLFDVDITSNVDIAYGFQSNVRFDLLLAHVAYSGNNKVVCINSQYSTKQIRFYLDPNNLPDRIHLSYTALMLGVDKRRELATTPRVFTGDLLYHDGLVRQR